MGSGTTLFAANNLNRVPFGIDIMNKYYEMVIKEFDDLDKIQKIDFEKEDLDAKIKLKRCD